MANIFISYNRQSEAIARALADDIEALGHTVWFDQDLSGGQVWWNQILATVRDCDVFVFVLDPEALNSTACKREYGYAADLGKPILPVLASGGVSTNLLPPALSQIHFVDYRKQDRGAALRLARALATVPPPEPLPDPLPPPPKAPISYLGSLTEQMEMTSTLSYEQQSALVVDLKRSLRDPGTTHDTRTLLERLRKRRDLFATIAEEIEELLTSTRKASPGEPEPPMTQNVKEASVKTPPETGRETPGAKISQPPTTQPAPTATRPTMSLRERLKYAIVGAILGTAVGVAAMTTYNTEVWMFGFLTGAGGAIAGAISGTHPRLIVVVLIGAAFGWFTGALFNILGSGDAPFASGAVLGAPLGAILGCDYRCNSSKEESMGRTYIAKVGSDSNSASCPLNLAWAWGVEGEHCPQTTEAGRWGRWVTVSERRQVMKN
jgi:hypothetical protein